ncbi:MAG: hypothetical protein P1U56_03600 [Saprospiraceae bacterium]|nr:hypothetical protein [Saprospiraceae bacterium]
MKSSKQKGSLLLSSLLVCSILLFGFQCTSNKKAAKTETFSPNGVVDTISNPNHSSPNYSEDQAKLDSIKKAQMKLKKKKTTTKTDKKDQ